MKTEVGNESTWVRSGSVAEALVLSLTPARSRVVVDVVAQGEAAHHLAVTNFVASKLVCEADNLETLMAILAIPRCQERRFVVTVRAPRSKDIDQHHLPAKALVAQRDRIAGEVGKAELEPTVGVHQGNVFPPVGQRGACVVGARGPPCSVIRIARPVVAHQSAVTRRARLKQKHVGSVERREAKRAVLERSFEIAIIAGRCEEGAHDAARAGILMKLSARGRGTL
jgi:hypothetical protein